MRAVLEEVASEEVVKSSTSLLKSRTASAASRASRGVSSSRD